MNEKEVLKLHKDDHIIGLHSYSHPTKISSLSINNQFDEYKENLSHLSELLNTLDINSVSHPCGDYNKDTLNVLTKLGIKVGFRSNMSINNIITSLEIPREDSSNVFKEMQK